MPDFSPKSLPTPRRRSRFLLAILALSALSLNMAACAEKGASLLPQRPANLAQSVEFDLYSEHTERMYRIFISVPDPSLFGEIPPENGFAALYVLDGNAFFPVHALRARGHELRREVTGIEPTIIIGVGYPGSNFYDFDARAEDYTPPLSAGPDMEDHRGRVHGGADRFLAFLEEELKPLLRTELPIDPARETIFGNSYGGLFVLHTLAHRPESFSRYIASSPSIWWGDAQVMRDLAESIRQNGKTAFPPLLLTVGSKEQRDGATTDQTAQGDPSERSRNARLRMLDHVEALAAQMRGAGAEVCLRVFPGEHHGDAVLRASLISLEFALGLPIEGCSLTPQGGD